MTYISIRDEIEKLKEQGELMLVEPALPGPLMRPIYATAEVYCEIMGPWSDIDPSIRHRMGFLRRDLDRFIHGDRLTVGHGNDDDCDLKPLDPENDEVWEFRSRAPMPSLRIFGRFSEQDCFIATNIAARWTLKGRRSREWAIEIARCKAEWRKLLPYCDPHTCETTNEYVTNVTDIRDIQNR